MLFDWSNSGQGVFIPWGLHFHLHHRALMHKYVWPVRVLLDMSDPIASCCLTAQTCALCPELPAATVSCWQLLGRCWEAPAAARARPRLWGDTATNGWACHRSREGTKHFNGHLPSIVASICWFIRASLPLEIHLFLKLIVFPYFTVHPADLSPVLVILHEMAICFLFPQVSHFSGSHMYFVVKLS